MVVVARFGAIVVGVTLKIPLHVHDMLKRPRRVEGEC